MSETDTPRTARQLVFALQRAAFACGEDNQTEHVSNARLNRHDAECRLAECAITERLETLERELATMTAHDAWQREQWEKMVSHGVGLQERLREAKAALDALIAENALTQRACDSWRKLAMDRLDELAKLKAEKGQP